MKTVYPKCPRVAVGAFVFHHNRVLLVQRGAPPSKGKWAIPGGSVELGETLQEAAEREIMEETGITIHARMPAFTFDVVDRDETGRIRFHYVIVDLVADYVNGEPRPGDDALDVRWASFSDIKNLDVSEKTLHALDQIFKFGK
ncbi:MAG: NUDIX hydrolase [Desulfobacterales bacterium]